MRKGVKWDVLPHPHGSNPPRTNPPRHALDMRRRW